MPDICHAMYLFIPHSHRQICTFISLPSPTYAENEHLHFPPPPPPSSSPPPLPPVTEISISIIHTISLLPLSNLWNPQFLSAASSSLPAPITYWQKRSGHFDQSFHLTTLPFRQPITKITTPLRHLQYISHWCDSPVESNHVSGIKGNSRGAWNCALLAFRYLEHPIFCFPPQILLGKRGKNSERTRPVTTSSHR